MIVLLKPFSLVLLVQLCFESLVAQKQLIDTGAYNKWTSVDLSQISNDGRYAFYSIKNEPLGGQTFVFRETEGSWEYRIEGINMFDVPKFSSDSKHACFQKGDSIVVIKLGTSGMRYISSVQSYLLASDDQNWLAYLTNKPYKRLVIQSLPNQNQVEIPDVVEYYCDPTSKKLLIVMESLSGVDTTQTIALWTLASNRKTVIWKGRKGADFFFNEKGTQLAFVGETKDRAICRRSIWHYKHGDAYSTEILNDDGCGVFEHFRLGNIKGLTQDNVKIIFNLIKKEPIPIRPTETEVDVWSFFDPKVQEYQLKELATPPSSSERYAASVDTKTRTVIQLEKEGDDLFSPYRGAYMLVNHADGDGDSKERTWNVASRSTYYLVSLADGSRRKIDNDADICNLTPNGKYLVYYDSVSKAFFSVNTSTTEKKRISGDLFVKWNHPDNDRPDATGYGRFVGWVAEANGILISDFFDIWHFDLTGQKRPINITNGYGIEHNIQFRIVNEFERRELPFGINEEILLNAFNRENKQNGFFKAKISTEKNPQLLTMGDYLYQLDPNEGGWDPQKAKHANAYLLTRQTASQSPNCFFTKDFKKFAAITNVYPEQKYNWLTSELVTLNLPDGNPTQGILYKPENFDSAKKYPIIFYYYEKYSNWLHKYLAPDWMSSRINIPRFVSNGYLVFTPDIHYTIGKPGQSALSTMVSAVDFLAKFPFVDQTRMGLQGHSFGGYQTNFLITHTNLFAAAMSAAGAADITSQYNSLWDGGANKQHYAEIGQGRIGSTLWQNPDAYISNSPIFKADKVATPLLMMNNKKDGAVQFSQGLEFFLALRRLGKRVWMLQYDNSEHWVIGRKAVTDFDTRVMQFFDHYLKGKPAPKWMTQGIPAKLKGIASGLELDHQRGVPPANVLFVPNASQK